MFVEIILDTAVHEYRHMNSTITRLIALDFDGTSAVYEPCMAIHPGLADMLAQLRRCGYGWVLNSDRYIDTLIEISERLDPDVRPEAVLSAQRFIYRRNGRGVYEPLQPWNDSRMELHRELWRLIKPLFPQWQREIESDFTVRDRVVNDVVFACMVPADENAALRERMRAWIRPWPNAQLSGNHEWSFILHADFSKAAVLEHYCEVRGIEREKIIAVGDGYNDITMLDATLTPHAGCPADACPEVRAAVRAGGGYVAHSSGPEGTIEVIRFYHGLLAGN
jgi:hydroxymethylpyrimidine pyrophosphatase-like HAD family hydrolase